MFAGGNDLSFFKSCLQKLAVSLVENSSWGETVPLAIGFDDFDGLPRILDAFEDISGRLETKEFPDYEIKSDYYVGVRHISRLVGCS